MGVIRKDQHRREVGYYKPDGEFVVFRTLFNEQEAIVLCSKLNGENATLIPDHYEK